MAGEYRLGRKLGEGGFGAVYEAEHPLLKRRAAVKVLHRVGEKDSEAVQRFISEAQAVNQIRSQHIVDIFSFGRLPDGRHFYVMDLLEGEPLDRYLERVSRVDVVTALQLLRPIAEALDVAHAAGIVHRDLKPQNIFLAWDATGTTVPKLLDFGMAKLLGEASVHTVSGTPMGTPLYMSPEQARGQKVDQRSDVYALGVLFHELLTGRLPIVGDTTIAVLMAHITQDPPRVSEVCADLSALLDEPILRMLEKQPEQRPRSAGEALLGLIKAAESAGYSLPPGLPRLPRPAPQPASERPGAFSSTFAAESPSGRIAPSGQSGADAGPGSASGAARPLRWPLLGLLLALACVAAYLLGGSRQDRGPAAEGATTPARSVPAASAPAAPSVRPAGAGQPLSSPPSELPAGAHAESVAAPESSDAGSKARGARRKKDAAHAQPPAAIPDDLENPF